MAFARQLGCHLDLCYKRSCFRAYVMCLSFTAVNVIPSSCGAGFFCFVCVCLWNFKMVDTMVFHISHVNTASWQYWFGAETEQALASFPLYQSLQRPHDKDVNLGNHMKLHTVLLWNNQGLTMLSLFLNLQQNHSFYCLNTNTKRLTVPLQTANKVGYLIKRTFLLRFNL